MGHRWEASEGFEGVGWCLCKATLSSLKGHGDWERFSMTADKGNKKKTLIPIFKKEEPGNHRPVNLPSSLGWLWKKSSWQSLQSTWRTRRWLGTDSMDLPRANYTLPNLTAFYYEKTGFKGKRRVVYVVYSTLSKAVGSPTVSSLAKHQLVSGQ